MITPADREPVVSTCAVEVAPKTAVELDEVRAAGATTPETSCTTPAAEDKGPMTAGDEVFSCLFPFDMGEETTALGKGSEVCGTAEKDTSCCFCGEGPLVGSTMRTLLAKAVCDLGELFFSGENV